MLLLFLISPLMYFQATHMAFPVVNEENVYLCTGNPLPSDIYQIVQWMLNEDFATAYSNILFKIILPSGCGFGI